MEIGFDWSANQLSIRTQIQVATKVYSSQLFWSEASYGRGNTSHYRRGRPAVTGTSSPSDSTGAAPGLPFSDWFTAYGANTCAFRQKRATSPAGDDALGKLRDAAVPGDSHRPRRDRVQAGGQKLRGPGTARLCGEEPRPHRIAVAAEDVGPSHALVGGSVLPSCHRSCAGPSGRGGGRDHDGWRTAQPHVEPRARHPQPLPVQPRPCHAHRNRGQARPSDSIRPESRPGCPVRSGGFGLEDPQRGPPGAAELPARLAKPGLAALRRGASPRAGPAAGAEAGGGRDRKTGCSPGTHRAFQTTSGDLRCRGPGLGKQRGIGRIHGDSSGSATGHRFPVD